jgi:hypothetical protein
MSDLHQTILQKTGSSSRLKACDSCRYRHIRCEFDGHGTCVCCQVYDLECSFGKRKDEICNGRRRHKASKRIKTGFVPTAISMAEPRRREPGQTADGYVADHLISPYQKRLGMSSANKLLDAPGSLHATSPADARADESAMLTFSPWRDGNIPNRAGIITSSGPEAYPAADNSLATNSTTADTVFPRISGVADLSALSIESMVDSTILPAHVHDISSSDRGSATSNNPTANTEFDQFCRAMVIPFITDPTSFNGSRSTLLGLCLKMAHQNAPDMTKDKLLEILCVELNSAVIRDDTTCLALLLVSMQTRAAPAASLISQICLTYVLSLGSSCSSAPSSDYNKLLAKVIVADGWNALAHNSKPSIPRSLHPPNPFSSKTEEYMHHLYNLSCLLVRIMLFTYTTTNEERFRVEYELWLFPVALSQKYMWISPVFASVDSNTLHMCFWMLILLYYIPHIGRPYMGLDPSMGLLLPLQHFGSNIMVVMFGFRETLWNWHPAQAALRLCIENLCDLEIKYESDEVVSVLQEFVRLAKAPSVFPYFSTNKELLPLIAKAEQCDRPVVPRKYDKATVVWMFRDLRVMSLSMLSNLTST